MEDFGGFRWNFAAGPFPMVTIEDKHRGWLGNTGHWKMSWPFLGPKPQPAHSCYACLLFVLGVFFFGQISRNTHYILPWFFFFNTKLSPIFVSPTDQAFGRLRRWCRRRLNLHHFPRCFGHRGLGALVALVGGKCGSLGKAIQSWLGLMWGLWKSPPKKKWGLWKIPAIWRFLLKDGDFSKVILVFRGGLKNPFKKKVPWQLPWKKRIRLYIFIFSAILLKTALRKWIQKKVENASNCRLIIRY